MTSSPLSVFGLNVSISSWPRTTVPTGALGVIVTVIVPVWPGSRISGLNEAFGSTASAHRSPVSDVTAESNRLASTAAAVSTTLGGLPVAPNGPTCVGSANQAPLVTSGAVSTATEALAKETPSMSGSPKLGLMSIWIGSLPLATMTSWSESVGTRNAGTGSPPTIGTTTDVGLRPSNGSAPRWLSRGSTKYASVLLPLLVTVTVTVRGWPAGSFVFAECGSPVAVIGAAAKSIMPVNGSCRFC